MPDHFASLNRGEQGFTPKEFTTGIVSTTSDDIEIRIRDGAGLTKLDVINALNAFRRFFENPQWVAPSGFDVKL
jgi:hypothetical protein